MPDGRYELFARILPRAGDDTQTAWESYPAPVGGSADFVDPFFRQLAGSPVAYSFVKRACEAQLHQVTTLAANTFSSAGNRDGRYQQQLLSVHSHNS